jgi:hypothetical protein
VQGRQEVLQGLQERHKKGEEKEEINGSGGEVAVMATVSWAYLRNG